QTCALPIWTRTIKTERFTRVPPSFLGPEGFQSARGSNSLAQLRGATGSEYREGSLAASPLALAGYGNCYDDILVVESIMIRFEDILDKVESYRPDFDEELL